MNSEHDQSLIRVAYEKQDYVQVVRLTNSISATSDAHTLFMHGEASLACATNQQEAELAVDRLITASSGGSAHASELLGLLFDSSAHVACGGSGWVTKDEARSSFFFGRALNQYESMASSGDPDSSYMVGVYLLHGQAGRADFDKAVMWLKRSASLLNPNAAIMLAEVFSNGLFTPPNKREFAYWKRESIQLGVPATLFPFVTEENESSSDFPVGDF
jgi:TPR repeat protein